MSPAKKGPSHPVEAYIGPATWNMIEPKFSQYAKEVLAKVIDFVENECLPAENIAHDQISTDPATRWKIKPKILEELKASAKAKGLWNLFLSKVHYPKHGVSLTTLEYGVMCEIMGRSIHTAPIATNCAAPDTGNMEVLAKYGFITNKQTPEQQKKWLGPLMNGDIKSAFSMTEKGKASSDARNISTSIVRDGNEYVINGHKHWISGAGDPECALHVLVGKTDPKAAPHKQQSVILIPANTPGIQLIRPMTIFGYDDAPHGHFEIIYKDVRVPAENIVAGVGRGFEVLQGRLGPGRIHHCMRGIGVAARGLDLMIRRVTDPRRTTFGKQLHEHGTVVADIAQLRIELDQTRWLVYTAANAMDMGDAKSAMKEISEAKIATFTMTQRVLDRAMQVHGGEGLDHSHPLAYMWAGNRTLRYADGPDEVHIMQLGKTELKRAPAIHKSLDRVDQLEQQLRQRQSKI